MKQATKIGLIFFLFLLSIFLQTHMYQHWDMLFALEGGKRFLAGGTYVNDVFDNNPPLIYYFTILITIFANILSVNSVFVFKLVVYIIILYSLYTCNYLLNCTPNKKDVNNSFLLVLAFCLLILPVICFGEREHLMIALVMPYFLLVNLHASRHSNACKSLIAVAAGCGFCLKPHFLFSLIFCEILLAYWQRKWWYIFRIETLIIAALIIIYLISIFIFMPSYYFDVLPMALEYYVFNNVSNYFIFLRFAPIISFLILMLSLFFVVKPLSYLNKILIAAAFGFALAAILQGKSWYYQFLPLITMNSLIATLIIYNFCDLLPKKSIFSLIMIVIIMSVQVQLMIKPLVAFYDESLYCFETKQCSITPLIQIAKKYAKGRPIYFFTTLMSESIPVIYYSDTLLGSRFSAMWLLSGIINRQHQLNGCDERCIGAKNKVRNYIVGDFKRYQPKLVFVDISFQKQYIKEPFDYLSFMQESPQFKTIWQQYDYLTSINNYDIYIFNGIK